MVTTMERLLASFAGDFAHIEAWKGAPVGVFSA
jgi:hypothetical protein